MEHILNIYLHM